MIGESGFHRKNLRAEQINAIIIVYGCDSLFPKFIRPKSSQGIYTARFYRQEYSLTSCKKMINHAV